MSDAIEGLATRDNGRPAVVTPETLRAWGQWSEGAYEVRGQALAVKRFTWTLRVRARHAPLDLTLSYFSDVTAHPERLADLAYVADRERGGLEVLVAMVRAAVVDGVGYLAVPDPERDVYRAMHALVQSWAPNVPVGWEEALGGVVRTCFSGFELQRKAFEVIRAYVDPAHPSWGFAFEIVRPERREQEAVS